MDLADVHLNVSPPIAMAVEELHATSKPSTSQSAPKKSKKRKQSVTLNATTCKYDVVKNCAISMGYTLVSDLKQWSLFWIDTGVSIERILEMCVLRLLLT